MNHVAQQRSEQRKPKRKQREAWKRYNGAIFPAVQIAEERLIKLAQLERDKACSINFSLKKVENKTAE